MSYLVNLAVPLPLTTIGGMGTGTLKVHEKLLVKFPVSKVAVPLSAYRIVNVQVTATPCSYAEILSTSVRLTELPDTLPVIELDVVAPETASPTTRPLTLLPLWVRLTRSVPPGVPESVTFHVPATLRPWGGGGGGGGGGATTPS